MARTPIRSSTTSSPTLWARNTLTQRAVGPVSVATVTLDAAHLKGGDIAGLGILNMPCAWLGVAKDGGRQKLRWYSQKEWKSLDAELKCKKVFLRVTADLDGDMAQMSYSLDGQDFRDIGDSIMLPYQMKTFQGPRYALFAYNATGRQGGYAAFDNFTVDEPLADRSHNIPVGQVVTLTNLGNDQRVLAMRHGLLHSQGRGGKDYDGDGCRFLVVDRGQGRVALKAMNGMGYVTVVGAGLSGDVRLTKDESLASLFLWQDMLRGECMLLSLKTQRYMGLDPTTGEPYSADFTGTTPNRRNGTVFRWEVVKKN